MGIQQPRFMAATMGRRPSMEQYAGGSGQMEWSSRPDEIPMPQILSMVHVDYLDHHLSYIMKQPTRFAIALYSIF
jgi:hypothetical protein